MTKKCIGCGVDLQYDHPEAIGYSPKADAKYCKRCFRIKHYDDVMISMQTGIDNNKVLSAIEAMDALVLWVVDVFDFEANIINGLNRHLKNKNIVLIGTKRDLLPDNMGNEKLSQFMLRRLKQLDININGLVICGNLNKDVSANNPSIKAVIEAINHYRDGGNVVIMGMANAGKSTLVNAITNQDNLLTTSRYPGTTLDLSAIDFGSYTLWDTPGLTREDSLLTQIDQELLKTVIPQKALKARNYQLKGNQSLALGGLVRLDLFDCDKVSCVGYFSEGLNIHRSKGENADNLWATHLNGLLSPSLDTDYKQMHKYPFNAFKGKKIDVVIHGLGFFTISGDLSKIDVYVNKNINVTFREAMI